MKMTEILLAQLEREARTRKALERVPEGKNDWKPHERSMPLGYLAALCASMPGWIASMIEKNHLDLGKGEARNPRCARTKSCCSCSTMRWPDRAAR